MKQCSRCGKEQSLNDFSLARGSSDGHYAWCKACSRQKSKAWYHANKEQGQATARAWKKNNPDRVREQQRAAYSRDPERYAGYAKKAKDKDPERYRRIQKDRRLRRTFGITLVEYEGMLAKQNGVCRLCFEPAPDGQVLYVDHCHVSQAIRGLLCQRCNWMLGRVNDDPKWFDRAARYLRRHAPPE